MTCEEIFKKLLKSFQRYYDIKTDDVPEPFCALAEFRSVQEQYFLLKSAKLSSSSSSETVFFYKTDILDEKNLLKIDNIAWEETLKKVNPVYGHQNSDCVLIVIADQVSPEAFRTVKKLKHYKSYKFGLCGWSSYKACVYSCQEERAGTNWRGKDLRKFFV